MKNRQSPRPARGFTLIELIVTMSILSVILLMALQVTESTRRSIRISEAKSTNDAIARRAFDQISRDFAQMVVRDDARLEFKSLTGNDSCQFYTNTRGLTTGGNVAERGVTLVSYTAPYVDTQRGFELTRGTLGHDFNQAAGSNLSLNFDPTNLNANQLPNITPANLQALSSNIFRFELQYLYAEPSTATASNPRITREVREPNSNNNFTQKTLRGVTITLATLDDRSRRAVQTSRLETLASQFPDATANADTLTQWTTERDRLALNGALNLPKDALQSIRCYQRTFLIP